MDGLVGERSRGEGWAEGREKRARVSHPLSGSTTMAWGSSIMPEISVLRFSPFICATSMTSRPESVQ